MQRRLLIISKEPEFDTRGDVVPGQCEPFTSGWTLTMILPDRTREDLMVGTYTDLRKIQESCLGLDDPETVRKRVKDMRVLLVASITETVVAPAGRTPGDTTETREMPAITLKQTPGGLLNIEPSGSVIVATVLQPERADDESYLKSELSALLECRPKALLMDLGRVSNLSAACFKELAGVRDRLREAGASFALCNLTQSMRQRVLTMKSKESLSVFEDQASALAALKD
ncbi:MAG: STAS domain-containing protein [Planctomycetota bacterium]|nr:STAS domain-containing protein [Planctomycetota bacterium]